MNLREWTFEKVKKGYAISIIISISIITLVLVNIIKINYMKEESKYMAKEGILDLRNWKMDKEKILKLDGQWEFYPGKLIKPEENFSEESKEYVDVPGSWSSYLSGEGLENGSGTYRLTIMVPEDMIYGIKTKTIRFSNRIYFNGEEISHVGNPSLDKNDFRRDSKYNIGVGKSLDEEIELIVHVTSLEYRSGGIIKSIELGSADSIIESDNINLLLDAFVVSVCLSLGLYFLAMFFQRNKDLYLIYFSGTNIFMALYLSTMNEQILRLVYNYGSIGRSGVQIFSMVLTTICFLRFVHHFFKEYSNEKITNIITMFMVFTLVFVFKSKGGPGEISLGTIQTLVTSGIGMSYTYMFYILIKAIFKKTDSIEYILVIVISISSYWMILLLKTFLEIDLGNNPVFLILLMMFSVSGLTSHRLQLDYEKAKRFSEKLIRDDKLKDEFLLKSSHELKIPLEVIENSTKNLLKGKKGALNIKQQENLFSIYQEVGIIRRLTDDLLDASLIKGGKIKLQLTSIEPYKTVQDILKEIEVLIPYNDSVILENQIEKEFPAIRADHDKFRQIIYDLVSNAIKYTKTGEIIISASLIEGQAEIQVKDTGIGIEEKYLKEVFEIFYQNNEENMLNTGLGLGLPIVKHLVENQNGEIRLNSIYGKGSSFIFTLPLYKEDEKDNIINPNHNDFKIKTFQELSSNLEEDKYNDLGDGMILIVGENLLDENILCEIENDLGYEFIMANNGRSALDILENYKIDLIILDFMLSDMTGGQLCNKIREEYAMGELPILMLASSGRTIDLMGAFNYGANDFQRKPVEFEELKSRIQFLLLIKASAEEGLEKEFQYFYSQITPHFLYNTLNSIIGISYKDSDKTRKALNNLSVYLRGKLDIHRKKGFVTLESELELVTAYLEIEELRYGDRLKLEYNIEEGLKALIPPLTLQPIVENSVHHGIATKASNGIIKIITKKEPRGFISITIEDNGKGMTLEEQEKLLKGNGRGIGFKNVMERIKILKGATLTLESNLGKGTKVQIIIPEVKNNENNLN